MLCELYIYNMYLRFNDFIHGYKGNQVSIFHDDKMKRKVASGSQPPLSHMENGRWMAEAVGSLVLMLPFKAGHHVALA